MIYVCDHCGHLEARDLVPKDGEWTCAACAGGAAWEFPSDRRLDAEAHAAHIARGNAGGIFRPARR